MFEWPVAIEVIVAIILGILVIYLLKIFFSAWQSSSSNR